MSRRVLEILKGHDTYSCSGPVRFDCIDCEDLNLCKEDIISDSSIIPGYITEQVMPEVTPESFKMFVCINSRICCHNTDCIDFGIAYLTNDQIIKRTAISRERVGDCIKELTEHRLISCEQRARKDKKGNTLTYYKFTVHWIEFFSAINDSEH